MPSSERRRSRFRFHEMQKKSGRYYGILKDLDEEKQPSRKWFALGTSKKGEAHAEYERLQHLFWLGEWSPWESSEPKTQYTAAEAIEEFLEYYEGTVREKTARVMQNILKHFREHVGPQTAIRSVTADQVRTWLQTPTSGQGGAPAPNTIKTYLRRLSRAMGWMEERGILQSNPCEEVDPPDASGDTFTVLSPEEINELLRQIITSARGHGQGLQTWLLEYIQFNACAGLRIGEVCALRWVDVERLGAESDMATVHVRPYPAAEVESSADGFEPKTRGSVRQVHVWPRGTKILRRLCEKAGGGSPYGLVFRGGSGGPMSANYTMRMFREHAEAAGLSKRAPDGEFIRRVRPHDLRHTWISWLVNEFEHELGLHTVADMAGHEDTSMTSQYRRSDPVSTRDAMLRVGGKKPEGGRRPTYEVVRDWLHADPVYDLTDLNEAETVTAR